MTTNNYIETRKIMNKKTKEFERVALKMFLLKIKDKTDEENLWDCFNLCNYYVNNKIRDYLETQKLTDKIKLIEFNGKLYHDGGNPDFFRGCKRVSFCYKKYMKNILDNKKTTLADVIQERIDTLTKDLAN